MQIFYPDSNRLGKMDILYKTLREEREMCGALFSLCVVLHVEDHESGRGKTYYAASDLFQPISDGAEIPEYRLEFAYDRPFENPEREAARVNSGRFGFVAIRKNIVRVPSLTMGVMPHGAQLH